MTQTPEQQAQVEQWRIEARELYKAWLWSRDETAGGDFEHGYLAGREAQQREDKAELTGGFAAKEKHDE